MISGASCTSIEQIGKLNMLSNRNVDSSLDYDRMTTYSGSGKKELKKSRATTIEQAVDETVRKVPNGEFLMNVKIYSIKNKYYAVEGDVWGIKENNVSFRGFSIGDKVIWKNTIFSRIGEAGEQYLTGTIKVLKDDQNCLVTIDDDESKTVEVSYEEISKLK